MRTVNQLFKLTFNYSQKLQKHILKRKTCLRTDVLKFGLYTLESMFQISYLFFNIQHLLSAN